MEKVALRRIIEELYSPPAFPTSPKPEHRVNVEDEEINFVPLFLPVEENCVCSDIYSLLSFFNLCGYEGECSYNEGVGYLICRVKNGIDKLFILSKTEPQEIPLKIIVKPTEGEGDKDEVEMSVNCYHSCIFYEIPGKGKITKFKVNSLKKISEMYVRRVLISYLQYLQGLVEGNNRRSFYIF